MRRPHGYGLTREPGKPDVEEDSTTCIHCNAITFVKPFQDPSEVGGFCRLCMAHICTKCAATGACDPFEKKLQRMESRSRFLRAVTE